MVRRKMSRTKRGSYFLRSSDLVNLSDFDANTSIC